MSQIVVFTLKECELCSELKRRLNEELIPFHDIEINENRELWDTILSQTGYDVLPTVFIQTDTEGNRLVYTPGRDFQSLDEIIKIIENNI